MSGASSQAVAEAAKWLSTTPIRLRPRPIVPHIKKQFKLSAAEAIDALRQGNELLARSH